MAGECINLSHVSLHYVNFGHHAFSKRSIARCHKLEFDFKLLFMYDRWNIDLDLQVEHVISHHSFWDIEKVLLFSTIIVVDEHATSVPVILSVVENLELDARGLARFHACVVLLSIDVFLLGHVLHISKVLDRDALRLPAKDTAPPR